MKKVSIVMPVYNGKEYIKESLDSILNQTYTNWELIIVNEFGSDDGSAEIIKSYSEKDNRIVLVQNTKREGISESLNIGLRKASGDYIARMDSDDISGPDRLKEQVEFLNENPGIGLCGIEPEFFGSEKIYWELEKDYIQIRNNIFFYTPCVHPTVMFRREIIDKYKIFYNKDYKATEDYDFFSRVCGVTDIANIANKKLFKYRMYANNATNRNNNIGIKIYSEVMKKCFKNYLNLDFTEDEINLLDCHISTSGKTGKELYDAVVTLDILLKKILVATKNNKKYDTKIMFNTLRKRWQELRWSNTEKDHTPAIDFIIDKSIFNRDNFVFDQKYDLKEADITIIMPVYNSEKYILDSVISLLDQTYKNFVLYVMIEKDNKDDTEIYLSLLKDNRIKVINNKEKLGLAKTLNEGIKLAKTKYIARMDSDDLSLPNRLEKEREVLENNENIALVSTWQRHFGDFGTYVHQSASSSEDLAASLLFKCDICHSTVMLRTKIMKENNYFYDTDMAMEDFDLWNRMIIDNHKLYCIPEILGEYRIHSENITQSKHQKVIDSEIKIISRSLERLHISPNSYDNKLLIGWDYIYNDYPNLRKKAKKLFDKIIEYNNTYKIYNSSSLKKALNKRLSWVNGIDEYVVEDTYVSPYKQSKIKKLAKKILKPFVMPFYSRLMYRVENKIDEKSANNSVNKNDIETISDKINNISNSYEEKIAILEKANEENLKNASKYEKTIKELNSRIDSLLDTLYIKDHYNEYNNGKVKICYIFQIPSFWPSFESIYKKIIKDERFDFKFYLLDMEYKEPSQMKGAREFLEKNNISYEPLTMDKLKKFNPHIAIIQTPYDKWHRNDEFSSDNLRKMNIRLAYIPYGTEFGATEESIKIQFDNNFLNNMWRIYTVSEATQRYYCAYSKQNVYSVKALGHPKFDGLYNKECTTNYDFRKLAGKKKIILVKIHFPKIFNEKFVTPDLNVYIELIKNIKKYKNAYFIFMLHPLMFDEEKNSISKELLNYINKCDDIFVFKDEDYREPLYVADAFICDRSSLAFEIAMFNKPTLFLENEEYKEKYVEEFAELFNCYNKGCEFKDIDKFISDVLNDQAKNSANICSKLHECISEIDGNIAERIINDLYDSITNNDDVYK